MSNKGVKRASPGAEEQKNPLGEVELSDDDAKRLGEIQKVMQRAEIALGKPLCFFVGDKFTFFSTLLQNVARLRRSRQSTLPVGRC
jgi:hypothetical protein